MASIFDQIRAARVMPILNGAHPQAIPALADAMSKGGLPCAEITLRTPEAHESLRILAARPDMLIGAGTILNTETAEFAVKAGAKFLVSPALNAAVVKWAIARDIPIIPGVTTPADIERAIDLGLEVVKFFPSEAFGGVTTMRIYAAVYPKIRFMPTGGITFEKLPPYLAFDRIIATGGSWIFGNDLVRQGKFDQIAELIRATVALAQKS